MEPGGSGPGEAWEGAEYSPGVGEDAVAVLRGRPDYRLPGVADHPGSHADRLTAQPLARGTPPTPRPCSPPRCAENAEVGGDVVTTNKAMLYERWRKEHKVRPLALRDQLCKRGIPNHCKGRLLRAGVLNL